MANEIANFTPNSGGFAAAVKDDSIQKPETQAKTLHVKMDKLGNWVFGRDNTPMDDATVAINVNTLASGYIDWVGNRVAGEYMALVTEPQVQESDLPAAQGKDGWRQQFAFGLKVVDGENSGQDLTYGNASRGAENMWNEIFDAAKARVAGGHAAYHPVGTFWTDDYPHPEFGKVYTPQFKITDWMDDEGNFAEAEAPKIEGGSRRRRA